MVIRTNLDDEKRKRRNNMTPEKRKRRNNMAPEKMKEIVARVKRNGNSCENLAGEEKPVLD
jgi:hypothetical protein